MSPPDTPVPPGCPTAADLRAFDQGFLSEAEIDRVSRHLDAGCARCEAILDGLAGPTDEIKAALHSPTVLSVEAARIRDSDRYQVLEQVGRGGMGVVYRAYDLRHDRTVALKRLTAWQTLDPMRVTRFKNEVHALAQIEHPNVVRLYDSGWQDEGPYLVMEYVGGPSLQRLGADGRTLAARKAATFIEKVARAVQAIHEKGLLHRDLKPANILLSEAGEPKVTDFGLARLVGDADARLTRTGARLGTLEYMPPEQARGESASLAPTADVYALGATLYELLTGRPPFQGATDADIFKQVERDDPLQVRRINPGIKKDLAAICHKCLEKDRARRYPTADALAHDLRNYLDGKPVTARLPGVGRAIGRWLGGHRSWLAVGVAASFMLLAVAYALWKDSQDRSRAARQANREGLIASSAMRGTQPLASTSAYQLREHLREWEATLAELDGIDTKAADTEWERYIRALLWMDSPDLAREVREERDAGLLRAVERFQLGGLEVANRLRNDKLGFWTQYKKVYATHTHSANFVYFFRREKNRVPNLERVVKIGDALTADPVDPGARPMLLRAYFADGNLDEAWKLAEHLLDEQPLSLAWRVLIVRDLVWVAICSPTHNRATRLETARRRVNRPGEPIELMVEKARLHCLDGNIPKAIEALDQYLSAANKLGIPRQADSWGTPGGRLGEEHKHVNVPILFYLDAILLRGVLTQHEARGSADGLARAERVWAEGFHVVRGKRTGSYYEAAILGSLSRELNGDDVQVLMMHTSQDTNTPTPGLTQVGRKASDPAARMIITPILRGAWRSDLGLGFARQIATHELPFSEFTSVQLRLWLFEGFCLAVGSPLSPEQKALAWQLAQDLCQGFLAGLENGDKLQESEQRLTGLAEFLFNEGWQVDKWSARVSALPSNVRGPLSYVAGRFYHGPLSGLVRMKAPKVVQRSWSERVVRPYFSHAWSQSLHAPPDSPLRSLVEADLRELDRKSAP
jgi:hypothetical protein